MAAALGAELGLPVVAKDAFKEALHDVLGGEGRVASQRLGVASFELVFHIVRELLGGGVSCIAEGNFGSAEPFASLPPARVVQVHVSAPPDVIRARLLAGRERHAVHYDVEAADEIAERATQGEWEPLPLPGELVSVETSTFPDVSTVVARVRERA